MLKAMTLVAAAVAVFTLTTPTPAKAEVLGCKRPEVPDLSKLEDGADSEAIHEAYRQVRSFQVANSHYRDCLNKQGASNGSSSRAAMLYNASVEQEREVARRFNTMLQSMKRRS